MMEPFHDSSIPPGTPEPTDPSPETGQADCGMNESEAVTVSFQPQYCTQCGRLMVDPLQPCPSCTIKISPASQGKKEASDLRSSFLLYFLLLGANLVVGLLMYFDILSELQGTILSSACIASLPVLWAIRRYRFLLIFAHTGNWKWYGVAAVGAIFTFGFAHANVYLMVDLFGAEKIGISAPFQETGSPWITAFLIICIFPAVFEELAFRGILFHTLGNVLKDRDTIVVTAFLFMLLHLTFLGFPYLFLLGLFLGFLRIQSQSLYPCMLLHFLHNTMALLTEF
jgi:uncharacterized protein